MRIFNDVIVYSATDIIAASECPFATLRRLDERLGWIAKVELPDDAMMKRVARLGDDHESRVLTELQNEFGKASGPGASSGVVEIQKGDWSVAALKVAAEDTETALRAGADVVFQAAFFDGRFNGLADFLLKRTDSSGDFEYVVADTKLARRAKTSALIQIAAYTDQLQRLGVPVAADGELILGDGSRSVHDIERISPVYWEKRQELQQMVDDHQSGGVTVSWGDPYVRACGRCDLCQLEVVAHRDVLVVAGMRMTQRAKLREAGIHSVDELAASTQNWLRNRTTTIGDDPSPSPTPGYPVTSDQLLGIRLLGVRRRRRGSETGGCAAFLERSAHPRDT